MYIPYYPPLSPRAFLVRRPTADDCFPFNAPNSVYFDFARQGIYCAGRRLKSMGCDRILFPSYHCGTELNALRAAGIGLNFYNILRSGEIDFPDLEAKLHQDIKGLYIIHYNGFPQDMTRILALKERFGLVLLEDAAVALFSQSSQGHMGEFGDISFFSLYKTLSVPTGGLVVAMDPQLLPEAPPLGKPSLRRYLMLARMIADWASMGLPGLGALTAKARATLRKRGADNQPTALNLHLDAPMSFPRLFRSLVNSSRFSRIIQKRRANFQTLLEMFTAESLLELSMYQSLPAGVVPLFYPLFVNNREEVLEKLAGRGIEAVAFWDQKMPGVPYSEDVCYLKDHVLGLPIHQGLNKSHMEGMAREVTREMSRCCD